jgi:hypothetical protein
MMKKKKSQINKDQSEIELSIQMGEKDFCKDYYWEICDNCGHKMIVKKCKLICEKCGFFHSCSEP